MNTTRPDIKVNFLKYTQTIEYVDPAQDKKGVGTQVIKFSWLTDIPLTVEFIYKFMRAGRGRWKIENETFKTLKEGTNYNMGHSYGHGKKHLCTILGMMAMLAFLIDQAQEAGCELFRELKKRMSTRRDLWESLKRNFYMVVFESWKMMYELITGIRKVRFEWVEDTS